MSKRRIPLKRLNTIVEEEEPLAKCPTNTPEDGEDTQELFRSQEATEKEATAPLTADELATQTERNMLECILGMHALLDKFEKTINFLSDLKIAARRRCECTNQPASS